MSQLTQEGIQHALGRESNRGKLGLSIDSSEKDQELALKWAALASYLPNGLLKTKRIYLALSLIFLYFAILQMLNLLKNPLFVMSNILLLKVEST